MLSDFAAYLVAVIAIWFSGYWFLTAIPEALSWVMPDASTRKVVARVDHWVSVDTRQSFYRFLFVIGFFIAGFIAGDDQYRIANASAAAPALETRISNLEGKYDALMASYQAFIKTSADRIPTQAQGTEALRREALTMSATMMAFVAEAEAGEPKPPPNASLAGGAGAAFQREVDIYRAQQASKFMTLHQAQLEILLKNLRANGAVLARSDYRYTNPFNLNDLRLTATDLAAAANQLF